MQIKTCRKHLVFATVLSIFSTNASIVLGMYDTQLGRFTTRDPISTSLQEPMTLHKYLYCRNGPINRVDPSGLWDDGVRSYLSKNGYPNALTFSDAQVNSLISGVPSDVWHGHSDFGYLQGDFDYTWLDNVFWTQPLIGPSVPVPFTSYTGPILPGPGMYLHFQNLDAAETHSYCSLLAESQADFEMAGHMGQDYFSHYNKGYRTFGGPGGIGHASAGHEPDNPYVHDKKNNFFLDNAGNRIMDSAYLNANEWTKKQEDLWYLFKDPFEWIGAND